MHSTTVLVCVFLSFFAFASVGSIEVGSKKGDRRQDYFEYGGGDEGFLIQGDGGSEGFEFGGSFNKKKKDSFSDFYGDPAGEGEGDDDEDSGFYGVFSYPDGEGEGESEDVVYDYGDVDYEGSEKKEKKEKQGKKDTKLKADRRKDTFPDVDIVAPLKGNSKSQFLYDVSKEGRIKKAAASRPGPR